MEKMSTSYIKHPFKADKFGVRPVDADTAISEMNVHEYGHVALVSIYGSDDLVVDAAQVSYGKTLSKVQEKYRTEKETRRLIRYLMRHRHTSPFEQAEVTFYLRLPIFVCRQLIRHRTANVNEYSARYSELSDDFYVPTAAYVNKQSTTNKQGRDDESMENADEIRQLMLSAQEEGLRTYKKLLELGVSRELARVTTSVGTYTEMYWKCDLHNLMHFLKLRLDPHAQQEIRDFATAMYVLVFPHFTHSFQAFEDYSINAYTLSAMEQRLLAEMMGNGGKLPYKPDDMSDREFGDFKFFIDTLSLK